MRLQHGSLTVLILAGGSGSRFGDSEKCLVEILPGVRLLDLVVEKAREHGKRIVVATSIKHRRIIKWAQEKGLDVVITGCRDYSEDYCMLVNALRGRPLLVMCGDVLVLGDVVSKLTEARERAGPVEMVSLCERGSALGVDLVLADRCVPGVPMSWMCVESQEDKVIDVDRVSDLVTARELMSRVLASCLIS